MKLGRDTQGFNAIDNVLLPFEKSYANTMKTSRFGKAGTVDRKFAPLLEKLCVWNFSLV